MVLLPHPFKGSLEYAFQFSEAQPLQGCNIFVPSVKGEVSGDESCLAFLEIDIKVPAYVINPFSISDGKYRIGESGSPLVKRLENRYGFSDFSGEDKV